MSKRRDFESDTRTGMFYPTEEEKRKINASQTLTSEEKRKVNEGETLTEDERANVDRVLYADGKDGVKNTVKEFIVYQGNQPIFTDTDEDTAKHFMHARKVECKRQGIDVNAKEHALEIR